MLERDHPELAMGNRRNIESLVRVVPVFRGRYSAAPMVVSENVQFAETTGDVALVLDNPKTHSQLKLACRTKGEAYRDGLIDDRDALEIIELSDGSLDDLPDGGHLEKRRIRGIGRFFASSPPLPLFPPPVIDGPGMTSILAGVRDSAEWVSIPAGPDPLGEFSGLFPNLTLLDTLQVLGVTGLMYSCLARARVTDDGLIAALVKIRNRYFFDTRLLWRWMLCDR